MNSDAAGELRARTGLWRANASLAMAGCLWGTGFLFGKIAFREMTVVEDVTFRFVFACIIFVPIAIQRRSFLRERNTRDVWLLLAAAVIGFPVQFLVQFAGLNLTTVSHASLIVGTLPVLIALASVLFLRERLRGMEWGVLLLSPIGALLVALSSTNSMQREGATFVGDLLVLLSMFAATAMILLSKHLMEKYDPLEITAWMALIGTVILLLWAAGSHGLRFHFSWEVWAAAAAQGFLATAGAFLFWNSGLARVPASRAGVFLNLEPLVGTCLGVIVLHETLGWLGLAGGVMILGSAIFFSRKG
jgi:drug/metabolite transporter (DMT)-like permease